MCLAEAIFTLPAVAVVKWLILLHGVMVIAILTIKMTRAKRKVRSFRLYDAMVKNGLFASCKI